MTENQIYFDIATQSLNKIGEELCGDHVEIHQTHEHLYVVMADGLGSGVKANILATMTSKIAITMLIHEQKLEEIIETLMNTLPICSVRKIAYSTFCIAQIHKSGTCRLIEYHNPPVFFYRGGKIHDYPYRTECYQDKEVRISEFTLMEGDYLTIVSDGAIHAGVGNLLNHGWEWEHIAGFLERQKPHSAHQITASLIHNCNLLYDQRPGDDTTVATILLKKPAWTRIFTGPPVRQDQDHQVVLDFVASGDKKVICGGTAANIAARELKRELNTLLTYHDPSIPPVATMDGIDLITEGVLTLSRVCEQLSTFLKGEISVFTGEDGASKLTNLLLHESTHIQLWFGSAINPAHQNPEFPMALSIKRRVVENLVDLLTQAGKIVTLKTI